MSAADGVGYRVVVSLAVMLVNLSLLGVGEKWAYLDKEDLFYFWSHKS